MIRPEGLAALAVEEQFWLLGGVLSAAALIEAWRPDRSRLLPRTWRWGTNLGLYFLTDRLFRVLVPYSLAVSMIGAIGRPHVEAFASIHRWGGPWAVLLASLLMLDLATYLIHRLEHAVFPLWRLHAVHHADVDVDASTAIRHHPLEAILNGIVLLAFMLVLGMPLWTFPTYAVIAVAVQVAQHANLKLPARLERSLGLVVMTPGLHRTHHASTPEYYGTNFGTVLSIWDRCFFTLAPPLPDRDPPSFGVVPFQAERYARPHWALFLPFVMRQPRRDPGPASGLDRAHHQ